MTPIFLDTNIPMYAAGQSHDLKKPCQRVMTLVDKWPDNFLTDSEVLQEILHRYYSVRRWHLGRQVMSQFVLAMGERIAPIFAEDVQFAGFLADQYPHLDARDLVHAAVMQRLGVTQIVSTDGGFDHIEGIERLDPMLVEEWTEIVASSG